ncbi:hypothetical protein OG453_38895 [Streptomyces sp. NBC_01381]|uniref:hypothetical protein n=1 Tax=Streptomyces sp. NBC_01381 TaxID=2903845 RepID=UPI00224C9113|nr:hypothetical protein [Streptomyces sp. NBC_01381]MCX4672547.1 hypothetical protein [Streptomyces sp. NBC_01381]
MSKTMRNRVALPVSSARCDDARKSTPPGQLVEQARRLVDEAQEILKLAVVAERMRGTSWDTIGAADGNSTKSATHKRYSAQVTQWQDESQRYRIQNDNDDPSIDVEASDFDVAYSELEQAWGDADDVMSSQKYLTLLRAMSAEVTAAKPSPDKDEADSIPSQRTMTIEEEDFAPPGDDDGGDAVDHGLRRDTQDTLTFRHSAFQSLVRKAAWRHIRLEELGQPDFMACHDGKLLMYELKHLHSEDGPLAAASAWLDYPYAKPKRASVEERLTRLEELFGAYLAEHADDEHEE